MLFRSVTLSAQMSSMSRNESHHQFCEVGSTGEIISTEEDMQYSERTSPALSMLLICPAVVICTDDMTQQLCLSSAELNIFTQVENKGMYWTYS